MAKQLARFIDLFTWGKGENLNANGMRKFGIRVIVCMFLICYDCCSALRRLVTAPVYAPSVTDR